MKFKTTFLLLGSLVVLAACSGQPQVAPPPPAEPPVSREALEQFRVACPVTRFGGSSDSQIDGSIFVVQLDNERICLRRSLNEVIDLVIENTRQ